MKVLNLHWKSILGINILITGIVELFFYFYTVESPRTLIKLKRNADALEALKQIAKSNQVYEDFKLKIESMEYKELIQEMKNNKQIVIKDGNPNSGLRALFKSKEDRRCCLFFSFIWFSIYLAGNINYIVFSHSFQSILKLQLLFILLSFI